MGEFAKKADAVANDWQSRIARQRGVLSQHIQPSEEEATAKAMESIQALRARAFALGHTLRAAHQQHGIEELLKTIEPLGAGRDMMMTVPAFQRAEKKAEWLETALWSKEAGVLGAMIDPIRYGIQDLKAEAAHKIDEKIQAGIRPTAEPGTLPWYYPTLALSLPNATAAGYQSAEEGYNAKLKAQMDAKVEAAKKEFEEALQAEAVQGRKAASAGELLDTLATLHIKAADGELNQAAGLYGALAALLGQGGYHLGKSFAEKRDPRYINAKAMAEMARQRLRSRPIPVLVGPSDEQDQALDIPEDETVEKAAMGPHSLQRAMGAARGARFSGNPSTVGKLRDVIAGLTKRMGSKSAVVPSGHGSVFGALASRAS
jgi:hypothetical protein